MQLFSVRHRLLASLLILAVQPVQSQDHIGWRTTGGDPASSHYSALDQVNRDNVGELRLAWQYHSAPSATLPASSELQVNPIVIGDTLYGRNPLHNVFALDAATGAERWTFSPPAEHVGLSNMRGVTYWQGEHRNNARILFTSGHFLMALNAHTGALIDSFGNGGRVDLRTGLGRDPELLSINSPSPGVLFGDLIIMGSAVTESAGAAPGHIRAYNVISGEPVWTFHTIPQPGEFGHDTWPEAAWEYAGGANAWAGMSVDVERGVVYVPTGSPTPDFDGSRRKGANLFGNTLLALDARTGKRLWHYQTVHHDLWDRDLSSAPALVTVMEAGETRDLVAQASKEGVVYLLDRDTGEPVFPIEEVPVPASDIPGTWSYPTQPRVTLPEPFARQTMTIDDLTNITPEANAAAKKVWQQAHDLVYLRPPGLRKSILLPGFYGGANWGGGAFDPATNLYYINATNAPNIISMEPVQVNRGSTMDVGEFVFREQCSGCHGVNLEGFYPYAPALTGVEQRLTKREAMAIVTSGKGRMMPFAHLSQHERDAAVDYLFAYSANTLAEIPETEQDAAEQETVYVFAGYKDFVDERYYPAIKPPWGTLTAINLATGKHQWQIPLGEYEELSKEGIAPTGTRNFGGPVVTAGGLLIIAATSDEKLRIFDKANGTLLWEYALPAAGYATPATYAIKGRQYIVITASGGKLGTATGDQYLAFTLPEQPAN
ncbi:pyrrolo-quinoline quinone [Kineobactrum sediminis]|uniref:Pyrrolo-quinoline quinone n=1 Tax=Kineobactrum sediminis TaxID=1905677 RepID=A0A2N5Y1W0_9GAMM|nr:PQQ-binding-like beta-propeller repeat protein [Kineobactrum sediminis]PLW82359.1 pyrrolo-quinoline quinone [Kineobactrum sediminis]